MSLKNSNDTIGNRIRDLPVCSVVRCLLCSAPNCTVNINTLNQELNKNQASYGICTLNYPDNKCQPADPRFSYFDPIHAHPPIYEMGRAILVCITTRYGLNGPRIESW